MRSRGLRERRLRDAIYALWRELEDLARIYRMDVQEMDESITELSQDLQGLVEVETPRDSWLRIFAFSDYRIHDIGFILETLERMLEAPDLVVYAGDDTERFLPSTRFEWRVSSAARACENLFEKMAKKARFGLAAVAGNDDEPLSVRIHGEGVFDVYRKWIKLGAFLVVGLEGATLGPGSLIRSEAEYAVRLELAKKLLEKGEKIIVVSHAPPFGALDFAKRFGEQHVGSRALRIFLENNPGIVSLVICGHVHREGGKRSEIGGSVVVNVASHDFIEARRVAATILVSRGGRVERVNFIEVPSPLEQVLKSGLSAAGKVEALVRLGVNREVAQWLVRSYSELGELLFKELVKYSWMLRWGSPSGELWGLPIERVPLVGPSRARFFASLGIWSVEELANLDPREFAQRREVRAYVKLSRDGSFIQQLPLIVNYAKAIVQQRPLIVGTPKNLARLLGRPLVFLDLEYDTVTGFIFVVGVMEGESVWQAFAENEEEERKNLVRLAEMLEGKVAVTYAGKAADLVFLRKRFSAYGIRLPSFDHVDLYYDIINTQRGDQSIFLPLKDMTEKSVAEYLGYRKPEDLAIEDGLQALLYFKKYLETRDERLKEEILHYNKCDLERARYILVRLLELTFAAHKA